MMCEKCGAQIVPGNLYCEKCGAPVRTDMSATNPEIIEDGEPIETGIPEIVDIVEENHPEEIVDIPEIVEMDQIPLNEENPVETNVENEIKDINTPVEEVINVPEVGEIEQISTVTPIEENPEVIVNEPLVESSLESSPVEEVVTVPEVVETEEIKEAVFNEPSIESNLENTPIDEVSMGVELEDPIENISEIPEIVGIPSVEEVEAPVVEEENDTWIDKEPEPEHEVISYDPSEDKEEPEQPVYDQPKPDLLRGMNDLTQEELENLRKKEEKQKKKSELIGKINKVAFVLCGIAVIIAVSYFAIQSLIETSPETKKVQYNGYTFEIDPTYQVVNNETELGIMTANQSSGLTVQILENSYKEFEKLYNDDKDTFTMQMKVQYGNDVVKRVDKRMIEGQSFIVVTCISDEESSYVVYTNTNDDHIIQATYLQQDKLVNQSQFEVMAHSLLKVRGKKS